MEHNFFPQRPAVTPTIYAYRLPGVDSHKGFLKIGYTERTAKERIEEQLHTSKIKYEIVLVKSAMANDGSCFTDKDIHKILESKGCHRLNPLDKTDEWFKCSVSDVEAAILSLRTGSDNVENRTQNFTMRPEQFRAVEQTKNILIRHSKKSLVAHQSSCGMQKCVSGKHLPVISWQRKWGCRGF